MKKKFQIPPPSWFSGTPGELIKLLSPLIGILSEFSSSWKVPNVGSRLWLLQGHNLSTIVNYTMKSAKLSNAFWLHKCFIQCSDRTKVLFTGHTNLFLFLCFMSMNRSLHCSMLVAAMSTPTTWDTLLLCHFNKSPPLPQPEKAQLIQ